MNSQELSSVLSAFSKLVSAKAIAMPYRCIELSPVGIRGCSVFGIMERKVPLPINQVCCVNGTVFIALVNSMTSNQPVELVSGDTTVTWKCGTASGRLATIPLAEGDIPKIGRRMQRSWKTTTDFVEALKLGSISCDDRALAATGMYGVSIDLSKNASVVSTDGSTLSEYRFDGIMTGSASPPLTFSPDSISLMSQVIQPGQGSLDIDESGMYYHDTNTKLIVVTCTAPKLKDTKDIIDKYQTRKLMVPLPQAIIRTFVSRVEAMAAVANFARVILSVESGKIILKFAEDTADSEEYHLLDKQYKIPKLSPISLNAGKLARALKSTDSIVLDYINQHIIVLCSKKQPFCYYISGVQG